MPRASPILYERAYRHFSPLTLRTVFTPERTLVSDTLTVLSTFEEEDFTQSAKEMIPKPPSEVGYGGKSGYRLADRDIICMKHNHHCMLLSSNEPAE